MSSLRIVNHEWQFLSQIKELHPQGGFGIGDDAAYLPGGLLATVDALVCGVHFDSDVSAAKVAQKLLAVNLSDLAAMGGQPKWALLTLALAPGFEAHIFMEALQEACQSWNVVLIGGDTVSSATTVLSLTLLGEAPEHPARRNAAQPSDVVFVTGPLGGAVSSGRHLSPAPRVEEGQELVHKGVKCLMDLSDGLSSGLWTLAQASQVAFEISANKIPLHQDTAFLETQKRVSSALFEGEDFELLGTASSELWKILRDKYPLFPIGEVVPGNEVFWENLSGDRELLPQGGYEHQW